jgi:putative hydrolase of the HAD superfamily
MIKTIIFDVGGVILFLDKKKTLNAPIALEEIFNMKSNEANNYWKENSYELLVGKQTPRKFLELLTKKTGCKLTVDKLLKRWESLNRKERKCIDWDLIKLVNKLRQKYKIYVHSDTYDVSMHNELEDEIKKNFDGYFLSYNIGWRKTEKESYLWVLNKIKCLPEECVFIDDTEINLERAKELGEVAILYSNKISLIEQLKNVGVKIK